MLIGLVATSTLANIGTVLAVSAMGTASSIAFAAAGVCGFSCLLNWLKVCTELSLSSSHLILKCKLVCVDLLARFACTCRCRE